MDIKTILDKTSSLRILVVDDEQIIREPMCEFMKKFFAEVVCAENGEDALKKYHENGPFEVIFTDVRMPKMTGLELIQKIKSVSTPLFIAVASGEASDVNKNTDDYDMFIDKPIHFNTMLEMLTIMVETKLS